MISKRKHEQKIKEVSRYYIDRLRKAEKKLAETEEGFRQALAVFNTHMASVIEKYGTENTIMIPIKKGMDTRHITCEKGASNYILRIEKGDANEEHAD